MSKVYFISDLHLGHKKILDFSPMRGGSCVDTHSEWIVEQWNSVVKKKDIVWVLGDVCFDFFHLEYLDEMYGNKKLILGNHDDFHIETYQRYFDSVHGFMKYKGLWLSHAPVHPDELRGKINVHGHVHHKTLPDKRYVNVSVEANNGLPMSLEAIQSIRASIDSEKIG